MMTTARPLPPTPARSTLAGMLAVAVALAAGVVWHAAVRPIEIAAIVAPASPLAAAPGETRATSAGSPSRNEAHAGSFLARPLFISTRRPVVVAEKQPAPVVTPPPAIVALPPEPPAGIRLVGIVAVDGARGAMVRTTAEPAARLLREGDDIDGWRVASIAAAGVVLEHRDPAARHTVSLYPASER